MNGGEFMIKNVKIFSVFLIVFLILSGCTSNEATPENSVKEQQSGGEVSQEKTVPNNNTITDEGYGTLNLSIADNIATLSPQRYLNSLVEGTIVKRVGTRLYSYVPNEKRDGVVVAPQLADGEPVSMNEENTIWHIKVKDGMEWWNGDTLDAEDVEYSFKMLIDPKLLNPKASNLTGGAVKIKNLQQYYMQLSEGGTKTDFSEVGFKAIDNNTIEVITEKGQLPFEVMIALADTGTTLVYDKIFKETLNEDGTESLYGTDVDKMGYSGPYVLTEWVKGSKLVFEKNPKYTLKDDISLSKIVTKVVPNAATQIQLFEKGELDFVALSDADAKNYEQDPRVISGNNKRITSFTFNTANPDKPILANLNFKNAMFYALDRESIAQLIDGMPTPFYISTERFSDIGKGIKYRETEYAKALVPEKNGYNPELAKSFFDKAMEEEELEDVELTILYGDTGHYKLIAEYVQKSIPEVFGENRIKINLQAMPNTQLLSHRKTWRDNPTCYEITFSNWGGSTTLVWNGLKYHTSMYKKRNEPWTNDEFDRLWKEANYGESRLEEGKQAEYTAMMESIMFDEKPLVPIVQPVDRFLLNSNIAPGITKPSPIAGLCLEYASIKK
jgi:oligopeptide transport system substrate-binding protein